MSDTQQSKQVVKVPNPMSEAQAMGSRAVAPVSATANTDTQRAIAEVQAAMIIARSNPRDMLAANDRILNACQRQSLAECAIYQYARGGTDISGPSIRLAEAIAQNWGNMQFGIRELDQRNGESTVQAFAWDVETNTRREVTFQVPHVRYTRSGSKKLEDPRDIYEMVANQGARRLRACILAVIPGDVIDAAVTQCEETIKAKADTSPEGQKKLVDAFAQFGVSKEHIEKRIQRRLDAIQPAQVVALKKVYASLRDGMGSPSEFFEMADADKPAAVGAGGLKAAIAGSGSQAANAKPEPKAAEPAQAQPGADNASAAAMKTLADEQRQELERRLAKVEEAKEKKAPRAAQNLE